jgi:transposase InsO family protein
MSDDETLSAHERWARLRFSVVGPLLSSPPAAGQLRSELERLVRKTWRHPTKGELVHFALSTIERWYYAARGGSDPVGALRRKPRRDGGRQPAITHEFAEALRRQYEQHPKWSYKLHLDNLILLPDLGSLPSYSTLRRFMLAQGLFKQPRKRARGVAKRRRESREVRSYEAEYVGGLWHLDFHHGSLKVLTHKGEWVHPILLTILDDRSRLACHAQWYLSETAESLVHGLTQAFLKRGLPRSVLMDNGSAMIAAETSQGLSRLSALQRTTLPYSPHQNGKQEVFWSQVEGRLLAMLEGQGELSLALLNEATQAWVEMEYQRKVHSETAQTPLQRWLDGPSVTRECPDLEELRLAFTASKTRTQRRSDGTFSLEGIRFEVPARFRQIRRLKLRYASWDLGHVWLMDPRTEVVLARVFPLDKARNAEGIRRPLAAMPPVQDPPAPSGIAPLLKKLMADYAATGLPPAYIPKEET